MRVIECPPPGSTAKAGSFADDMHRANSWVGMLKGEAYEVLMEIFCGSRKEDDESKWPCEDLKTDWYDNSIELLDCREGLVVTEEQAQKILDMGFSRFWLNWADETQAYCYPKVGGGIHIGEREKR